MTENPGFLLTIAAFMLVIGPLVFVHELGHYFVARWFGVKAETFSIGFGREIKGWTDKRGTRWKLGWLPLGGYVKFAGDMGAASEPSPEWEALAPEEKARTFQAKPVWQRALIVVAGPAVNFLFAILVFAGFALAQGDYRTPAIVAELSPGSAAEQAGFAVGDRVVAINGREIVTFKNLFEMVIYRPGELLSVEIERGGVAQTIQVAPSTIYESDRFGNKFAIGRLGIAPPPPVIVPVGLLEAPLIGVRRTGEALTMMTDTLGQLLTGRRSVDELGGPLKIAQISGEQAVMGGAAFVSFIALISINLGFINLLPVPMLDGGHLLFYAIEAVRRKPVGAVAQEWAYRSGLLALLSLMVFVTFNDLSSFGIWDRLSGLIG